jgi:hypothetical protein
VIHLDWIIDQWDGMGHFYASLESGHTTASTGLKKRPKIAVNFIKKAMVTHRLLLFAAG